MVRRFIIMLFVLPLAFIQIAAVGLLRLAAPPSIDPSAQAWSNAVVSGGGTVSNTQLTRVSTLISCYKINSIWIGKDREWLGASENITQATIDIVNLQSATNNGMTFVASHGYSGNSASAYIDTNYVPSTGGGNFALNNNEMHVYLATSRVAGQTWASMGTNNTSFGADWFIYPWFADNNSYGANQTVSNSVPAPANAGGFWANSRIVNGSATEYQNGAQFLTIGAGGAILAPLSIVIGARRDGTAGAPSDFSGDTGFALYGFGAGLTSAQEAAQSNCVNAYMTSLGINVYASGTGSTLQATASLMPAIFTGNAGSTLPEFGVTTHLTAAIDGNTIPPATNATLTTAIGAKSARTDVNWEKSDPTGSGTNSFAWLSPTTTALRGAGLNVDLVYDYGNSVLTGGHFVGPSNATMRTAFGKLGSDGVTTFGATGFRHWLWNEENVGPCSGDSYSWSPVPSAANYTAAMPVAAAAMIVANAAAKIFTGGLVVGGGGCSVAPNTFIVTVAAGVTTNITGIGFHPYNSGVTSSQIPEQSYFDTISFRAAASNVKPVYWDEVGYSTVNTGNSETTKAIYVSRLMLSAVLTQVPLISIYDLIDDGANPNDQQSNFGMFPYACAAVLPAAGCTVGGVPVPLQAGAAYLATQNALTNCITVDANTYNTQAMWVITCHISGGVRRLIWSAYGTFNFTDNQQLSISAASAVDLFGNSMPVVINGLAVSVNNISPTTGMVVLSETN